MEQGFQPQTCDECQSKPATIHVTQIMNNETTVNHLCEDCAKKRGINITIEDIDNGTITAREQVTAEPDEVCENCQTTFSDFQKHGWLGCELCYQAFSDKIDTILREMHGSEFHQGKQYRSGGNRNSMMAKSTLIQETDIVKLRDELKNAIINEAFEEAAALRDAIKKINDAS